jgi:Protein of unknown function (DUF2795)
LTEHSLPSPALLQRHLHGLAYPARRDDLLSHARSECEKVISTLALLPDREYSRPTDVNKAFGELARNIVAGADYPAGRDELVEYAQEEGAVAVVIEALSEIPDRAYETPDAVVVELVTV